MAKIIKTLFRSRRTGEPAAIPAGQRIYAIGDIHGRLDLFTALAQAIEKDDKQSGPCSTTVILLGDLVDRGPNSARVVGAARAWARARKVRFLSGNHEEMLLLGFYQVAALKNLLKFGGIETLASYGIPPAEQETLTSEQLQRRMFDAIPTEDRQFLNGFETMIAVGDYLFVHAGIRPRTPLSEQSGQDCRWIREPFLSYDGNLGYTVVHGHTVTDDVVIRPNRIGIDTGAYASGILTAIRLEGTERLFIQARNDAGKIGIHTFAP